MSEIENDSDFSPGENGWSRQQRVKQTRRAEQRMSQLRPVMHMTYDDPLHIPEHLIPPGWTYYWVRESIRAGGEPDTGRVTEMRRKGWEPVPADRHPELHYQDFFGRDSHLTGYITHKGLILCERPTEMNEIEQKKYQDHNYKIMGSMPGLENFLDQSGIPGKMGNKTWMSKGVQFGD